jgi:large subunit ribosomal protein L25
VKGNLMHVDLLRIDLEKPIKVSVPVHLKGESVGVKIHGGLLEVVNREVEIEVLPNEIPEFFTVDVTDLGLNQGVRAGDLALSASMRLLAPAESVLVHVTAPRNDETAAAAAAEPEVVKAKGKKDDAAAPAGGDKKKK